MKLKHLLFYATTFLEAYNVHGHCIDIHSRVVSQGLHYVPGGTNPCTLCICDKGGPKWCKSVLCSPPQNCKSFQVGSSCCEFKCLDDILSGHDNYKETYDVALRFIASTVTAVLSISLLFFLYNRLKRNKLMAHHNHQRDEQRNHGNVGYITGNFGYTQHNIGYLGSSANDIEIRYEEPSSNFSLWKPPGNYFPSGEAPPPYEEAMRISQNESFLHQVTANNNTTLMTSFSTAYPQEITPSVICRHDENLVSATNGPQIANISSSVRPHSHNNEQAKIEEKEQGEPEVAYENINTLKSKPKMVSKSRNVKPSVYQCRKSRTRESCINSATPSSSTNVYSHQTHQSRGSPQAAYQRYLHHLKSSEPEESLHRTLPKNLRELLSNPDGLKSQTFETLPNIYFGNCLSKIDGVLNFPREPTQVQVHQTNVHKPMKNLLTYQSLSQDEEDYRSECENCKSLASFHNHGDEDGEVMNETMSLQRRPLSESGYDKCFRTSHTLPTNPRKQRVYPCSGSNRDKWFSSMQQSSSDESD